MILQVLLKESYMVTNNNSPRSHKIKYLQWGSPLKFSADDWLETVPCKVSQGTTILWVHPILSTSDILFWQGIFQGILVCKLAVTCILTCFNLKLSFQTHREGEQKLVPPIHLVRMHWPRRKTCFGLQIEIYRMLMQKHFAFKIWNHQNDSSISGFARVSEHDWVWSPTWLRFLRLWIFCFPDFTCQRLMQCQSEEKYWAADPWLRFELVHTRVLRAYGMEGDLGWQGRMETNVLKK